MLLAALMCAFASCKKEKTEQAASEEQNPYKNDPNLTSVRICKSKDFKLDNNRAAALKSKYWRTGQTLKVSINTDDDQIRDKIIQYASEWLNYANLKFDFVQYDRSADIRIAFSDTNSFWSCIGTYAKLEDENDETMHYGWGDASNMSDKEIRGYVLHEFGHAIGLVHEHQQPLAQIPWNKKKVYARWGGAPNYWTKEEVDRNLLNQYSQAKTQYTAFDKYSIMIYAVDPYLTDGRFSANEPYDLSDTDKSFIGTIYKF